MSGTAHATWNDWIDAPVVDEKSKKIGTLSAVYMDQETGKPEWLAVKTGLFGMKDTFIPIENVDSEGDSLKVPWAKDMVKDAPNVDPEEGYLPPEEEERLYRHYGRQTSSRSEVSGQTGEATGDAKGRQRSSDDAKGRQRSSDDAMTRSEEELVTGTRSHEAGRVRLRKYVVTENVTTTVPVRKEKVRIEREPITEANKGDATKGPDISEGEQEIVLNEEEVVTEKRTVPKERVRLDKDVEVQDRQVSEEVRKEQIDVDDGTTDKGKR